MPKIKCSKCGREFDETEKRCPECDAEVNLSKNKSRVVAIIAAIVIIVAGSLFAIKLYGASKLEEDLLGQWYQPDDDSCASIEISEHHLARNSDITERNIDTDYYIKFIDSNTIELERWHHESLKDKHLITFNEDKTEMIITPRIGGYGGPDSAETWYKGSPSNELLTQISNNRIMEEQRRKEEQALEEKEERYNPKNCYGNLSLVNVSCTSRPVKDVHVTGRIYNNGTQPIKNITVKISFSGSAGISWERTVNYVSPNNYTDFDFRAYYNPNYYGERVSCTAKIIDYELT